jgi:hypothetical protein
MLKREDAPPSPRRQLLLLQTPKLADIGCRELQPRRALCLDYALCAEGACYCDVARQLNCTFVGGASPEVATSTISLLRDGMVTVPY